MNSAIFAQLTAPVFGLPATLFWPYFAGAVALTIGLVRLPIDEIRRADGVDKLLWLAPLLVAIAMAIFGADHLTFTKFVARIVPKYMPWRLFWAYFVGFALLASALSLTTRIYWRLGATMLGIMLLLFVVMMHIPNLIRLPHEAAVRTLLLRDTALGSGILSFGLSRNREVGSKFGGLRLRLIAVTRFLLAIPVAIFGIEMLRNPVLAPGFPQDDPSFVITLPGWVPAHALWAYVTGAIFIACAVGLIVKRYAHLAANTLGVTVLALQVLAYIPLTIRKASDVTQGLNYFAIYCALSGAAFMMGGAVREGAEEKDTAGAVSYSRSKTPTQANAAWMGHPE